MLSYPATIPLSSRTLTSWPTSFALTAANCGMATWRDLAIKQAAGLDAPTSLPPYDPAPAAAELRAFLGVT